MAAFAPSFAPALAVIPASPTPGITLTNEPIAYINFSSSESSLFVIISLPMQVSIATLISPTNCRNFFKS